MKYRHLIIASAVSLACSSAFAQQDDMQQSDPSMTHGQPQGQDASSMSPSMIRQVQQKLEQEGMDIKVDGKWGPQTQNAVKEFQRKQGMQASGRLDEQTLSALGVEQAGGGSEAQSGQSAGGQSQSQSGQTAGGGQSDQGAGSPSAQGGGSDTGAAGSTQGSSSQGADGGAGGAGGAAGGSTGSSQ